MTHDSNARQGFVKEVSNDKGPFKLVKIVADGKEMDAKVVESLGVQAAPYKNCEVHIIAMDGDDGKAIVMVHPNPKDRVDQQKPGEISYPNHVTGNVIKHDADGNTIVKTKAIFHVNPPE